MTHSGPMYVILSCNDNKVLIPLLLDDPLWVMTLIGFKERRITVLIPLLLDDPLWEDYSKFLMASTHNGLNPSFAG